MFNGKIHYQWSFSIATLNYQRVAILSRVSPVIARLANHLRTGVKHNIAGKPCYLALKSIVSCKLCLPTNGRDILVAEILYHNAMNSGSMSSFSDQTNSF